MNEFLKPVVKKLNNFKFTALLAVIGGVISILLTILLFILYSRSGVDTKTGEIITAFVGGQKHPGTYIVGMIFFLFLIVTIILGIVIVAIGFPYLFPKDKMNPKKALPWLMVANGGLHFSIIIMVVYLLATEYSRLKTGFIIYIILGALLLIYSLSFILPGLKCHFYMPSLLDKNGNEK